jgi:heat shock protein HslJ/uncharacterized lipoprotein YbaY
MSLIRPNRCLFILSCIGLALAAPAAIAAPGDDADAASTLTIRGALSYTARIALPPDGLAIVELSDPRVPGGRIVAEQRIPLEGRQVPIPFELVVERADLGEIEREIGPESSSYRFTGAILTGGILSWVTEPTGIDPAAETVDLGTLMMQRDEPIAFSGELTCGDELIRVGFSNDRMRLEVGEQTFDLRQAVSASGARYVAIADPTTSFWSKGDGGTLEVAGTRYPECVPVETEQPSFRATGNEPAWAVKMSDTRVELTADLGETWIEVALTEPEPVEGGRRYENLIEDGTLTITILDRPCVDSMSGMPHPKTVEVVLDDRRLHGCGGEPAELLQGPEWVVEDIARAGIIDRSRVTLNFDTDGRLRGRASCNSYLGTYVLTGETLTLSPAATTSMACAPSLMDQETTFLDLLARVQRFEIDRTGALILHTDGGLTLLARRE